MQLGTEGGGLGRGGGGLRVVLIQLHVFCFTTILCLMECHGSEMQLFGDELQCSLENSKVQGI